MSNLIPFSFESTEIRAIANDQGEPWSWRPMWGGAHGRLSQARGP